MVEKTKVIPHKRGIAMIELIFSLVIMGIVLLSAPMLIQQSIQSGNVAIQQEAIAAAASQTSVILSMYWDENNNSNSAVSPMLDVNRAPFDFDEITAPLGLNGVTGRQSNPGGVTLPATPAANLGIDPTTDENTTELGFSDYDDVDDYDYNGSNDFGIVVFNNETTSSDEGDYVDINLSMRTEVNYTEDRVNSGVNTPLMAVNVPLMGKTLALNSNINNTPLPAGAVSNIKFIRVNLTSKSGIAELDKNITFEAFSCNIGTSLPQGRPHL